MRTRGLLLLLSLLLAGCASTPEPDPAGGTPTPATTTPGLPDEGAATNATLEATAVRASLNATPGHALSFPLTLTWRGAQNATVDVRLAGEGAEGSLTGVNLTASEPVTVFVPVQVRADAAQGPRPLALVVVDAQGRELHRRDALVTLQVLDPSGGYEPGDLAKVLYAGRLAATDQAFNTNDPALKGLPFAQTADYRFSDITLEVRSLPRPSVVPGFHETVLGMVPGESRTVTFPPEKGYGNATTEERVPREEVLQRRETLDLPMARLSTSEFADYLNETDQGRAEDYDVGDVVTSQQNGATLRYRIVNKTSEQVEMRMQVAVGERFTLYPFWPNGSVVEEVTEKTASFSTTPTTEEGEAFTFLSYWPQMTRVASMDEDAVTLRHDPPVGLKYSRSASQFQPPVQYTVTSVEDDFIVASAPSNHPLAGKALTFDVLVLDLVRGGGPG